MLLTLPSSRYQYCNVDKTTFLGDVDTFYKSERREEERKINKEKQSKRERKDQKKTNVQMK